MGGFGVKTVTLTIAIAGVGLLLIALIAASYRKQKRGLGKILFVEALWEVAAGIF